MAEIIKIDDTTWRIEDGFVRFFLLEGDEKAVLIDSGVSCPDAIDLARTCTNKPIILLNTHGDMDHTSGTGAFSEIYMHEQDYIGCRVGEKYPSTKLVKIDDESEIELGARALRIIHIPGHTRGSIAILDLNKRVLYAGDSVQKGHIYMFGEHRQPQIYGESLVKLLSLSDEYDYIYASHDEPVLTGDYVSKVRDIWNKVSNNEILFEEVDLFGNKVKSYTTEICGFYL